LHHYQRRTEAPVLLEEELNIVWPGLKPEIEAEKITDLQDRTNNKGEEILLS